MPWKVHNDYNDEDEITYEPQLEESIINYMNEQGCDLNEACNQLGMNVDECIKEEDIDEEGNDIL